jgi:hypothetical protein
LTARAVRAQKLLVAEPPDDSGNGTLVIAALLSLGLVFAGFWIAYYVRPGGNPHALFPWFGGATALIVALAIVSYVRRGRRRSRP